VLVNNVPSFAVRNLEAPEILALLCPDLLSYTNSFQFFSGLMSFLSSLPNAAGSGEHLLPSHLLFQPLPLELEKFWNHLVTSQIVPGDSLAEQFMFHSGSVFPSPILVSWLCATMPPSQYHLLQEFSVAAFFSI
jgi:hypothetical protein